MPEIRKIITASEIADCVEVQRQVWKFNDLDLVSAPMLEDCLAYGGSLFGAFDPPRRLVGFAFSFPALLGRKLIQHSHMLGVLEEYRDQGLGYALKKAQYAEALLKGAPLITWTFDPLEGRNAYLNLNKLGAVSRRYYVNLYGEQTSSVLHSGLGTDRLLAEWEVMDPPPQSVSGRAALKEALDFPQAIAVEINDEGLPIPRRTNLSHRDQTVALQIPARIQELKQKNPDLARSWRSATRPVFLRYLQASYTVHRVLACQAAEKDLRVFYLLRRGERLP